MSVHILLPGVLAVEVPKGENKIVWESGNEGKVIWINPHLELRKAGRITLTPGQWEIVGLAVALTEVQWQDLELEMNLDINYDEWWRNYQDSSKPFKTATESGLSLLSSHGLTESNLLILTEAKR